MYFSERLPLKAGKQTGIYSIDSSCLPVRHIKRSSRHQNFDQVADYGHTSVGWFFGLKRHWVINNRGELMAFKIAGNRHDSKEAFPLLKKLKGLAFGDKGYLGKKIFEALFNAGIKLITRSRKNMKNKPVISRVEKQWLNQRGMVIGHLKHCFQVWHTRHRSIMNALTHLFAVLAAYTMKPLQFGTIKMLAICANKTQ